MEISIKLKDIAIYKMYHQPRKVFTHCDPPNVEELIKNIPEDTDLLVDYANKVIPGWILTHSPEFSVDLYKFNEEWAFGCTRFNKEPREILIVQEAYIDLQYTTHTLIRELCRKLLVNGYIVIDSINFTKCKNCSRVIVSATRYNEKNILWTGFCQNCINLAK